MSTPSKSKPSTKPVTKAADKKAPTKKVSPIPVWSESNPPGTAIALKEAKEEILHLQQQLSHTNDKYEAVKERLSEFNTPQPEKIKAESPKDLTRSERILARFAEELNQFNHVSDLIDGKIEAIGGSSTQKEVIDEAKPSPFLDELEVCLSRFEVANKRNLLMFDHLCKII